jgi:cellulase/cellobiase CelA1
VEDPTDAPTPRDPLDDLVLVWTQQDEWIGGFCWYGQVTNEGKVPVVWQVEDSLPGLPNNIWGATLTDLGGGVWQFSGDGPLAPWESVDFGLCGSL